MRAKRKTLFGVWTHKIPCPYGRAMRSLLWDFFKRKVTVKYRERTVLRRTTGSAAPTGGHVVLIILRRMNGCSPTGAAHSLHNLSLVERTRSAAAISPHCWLRSMPKDEGKRRRLLLAEIKWIWGRSQSDSVFLGYHRRPMQVAFGGCRWQWSYGEPERPASIRRTAAGKTLLGCTHTQSSVQEETLLHVTWKIQLCGCQS